MSTHPQLAYAPLLPTFAENSKTIWQLRALVHGIQTKSSWRLLATNLNWLWPPHTITQLRSVPNLEREIRWTMYNLRNFRQNSSLTIYVESVWKYLTHGFHCPTFESFTCTYRLTRQSIEHAAPNFTGLIYNVRAWSRRCRLAGGNLASLRWDVRKHKTNGDK